MKTEWIEQYYRKGFSLAAVTSIGYLFHEVTGIKYMELRKLIFKEFQRIDSSDNLKLL